MRSSLRTPGRAVAAAVVGAAVAVSICAAAAPASADTLDDGQWWRAAMGVDELHRSGTGKGITVALIDGPIDSSVPELKGRVASSTTECLAREGVREPSIVTSGIADHATSMAALIVGSGKGTAPGGRGISGIDFSAPGTKVAAGQWTPSGWKSDVLSDGSSQATAITAGGLAALWSAHPDATGNQVLQAAKDAIGIHTKNGKYVTWFRRVGDNLPRATGKTESYGFGIMSPADAVKLDVESLPDVNPMVEVKGVSLPSAAEIAQATGGAGPSVTPSATSGSPTTSAPSAPAQTPPDSTQDTGSSAMPWLVGGAVVLTLLALIGLLVKRSRRPPKAGPPAQISTTSLSEVNDDTSAAADGAATTTKERSDGQS